MKKILSFLLVLTMLISAVAVFTTSVSAAETFKEGDVLYFKIESPTEWADNATLYANFTSYSRADNGGVSIIIASADRTKYDPVQGIVYDSQRGLYKYTVTAADAGAAAMRFWRGNAEKLWNCTVVITADDYASGKNTAVITDWDDTGSLISTDLYDLNAKLSISKTKGSIGDSIDIRATYTAPDILTVKTEIYINDVKVSDTETYTFNATEDGAYSVTAKLTATRFDDTQILARATVTGSIIIGTDPVAILKSNVLYAHASLGSKEQQAWLTWYNVNDIYYFFLPISVKAGTPVELYSSYKDTATIGDVTIQPGSVAQLTADPSRTYTFTCGSIRRSVKFMYSSAEAALFVNNPESFDGMDFFQYLQYDKNNYVSGTGAVAFTNGTVSDVEVKKMKGRGNTSWNADKKGFNITLTEAISIEGMPKCKKYSLVSNFQDAAMARNRILYDLSDKVGVPYASDSRIIDLYTNGKYQGTYQLCQKIEVGKNSLISEFSEDDYLNKETGGVKSDFSFVTEIDSSPSDDDFHFTVQNGNNLTMKAPELEDSDPNAANVRGYVKKKFNAMYDKLNAKAKDVGDYIDLDSLAKVYLINEFGKNWDSGASSFYLTYMPDANGVYKFFASPVWDYDNSLGNAWGVSSDLRRMGVNDYTLPSGWFSTVKGGYSGPNFLATAAKSPEVMAVVYKSWFEDFLPALDVLTSTGQKTSPLYSSDAYRSIIKGSAEMNYKIWALYTNADWVCDHGSLKKYSAVYTKNSYGQVTGVKLTQDAHTTTYDQYTYDGQFDYMMDWATSRAAWISAQYISNYHPEEPVIPPTDPPTEAPTDTSTEAPTETPTEAPTEAPTDPPATRYPAPDLDTSNAIAAWIFNDADKTAGDKLSEYGSSDGYTATKGRGMLTMSVSGDDLRALEWSDAEYGPDGNSMTPIMAAGKNNLWGAPYILLDVSTAGCSDIKLTMYLAGSNKAPASWKLQMSSDGTNFSDIEGAVATISAEKRKELTAYFDNIALPASAADLEHLYLRLVPVSMTTISGGTTADKPSGGEIALNYIIVSGTKAQSTGTLMGDADRDGEVSILDATRIQRFLAKLTEDIDGKAADITGDGIDILDATAVQRYLALLSTSDPVGVYVD